MRSNKIIPLRSPHQWLEDNRLILTKILIVTGVLAASMAIASRGSWKISAALMMLPFLGAGFLMLLRWPEAGLLVLLGASLAFPIDLIDQLGLTAMITLGLTALWVFNMIAIQKKITIVKSRAIGALLVFLVISFLAFLNGQLPWYPVEPAPMSGQLGGILIYMVAISGFLLTAHQIRDIRWLKALVFILIGIGSVFIFLPLIPGALRFAIMVLPPIVVRGSMFWTWVIVMAFSQALFNKRLHIRWRILLGLYTLGALYVALVPARAWTSGWFPPLVAILVALWIGMPRKAYFATLVGGALVLTQIQRIIDDFLYVGDNDYSQTSRLEAWRIILDITKVNPILGVGPANYSYYTTLFPIFGWYVQFNSHNNYVDIYAQTGILGLLCIIWFAFEIFRVGWRLRKIVPKGGFMEAYVYAALGGIVATFVAGMLGDWFLPYVYNATIRAMRTSIIPWLFMGGLLAIEQILAMHGVTQEGQEPDVVLD